MMRTRIGSAVALLTAITALVAHSAAGETDGRLVVHEWGTFTSFSGSNGVHLDFRPLQDNELPGFVVNRASQSGMIWLGKGRIKTRVRMETPVTYFYTDTPRTVRASVAFPAGLLTEFYPPVREMQPPFNEELGLGAGEPIGNAVLNWGDVDLLPRSALRPTGIDPQVADQIAQHVDETLPPQAPGNHYAAARVTDSALVHVRLPQQAPKEGAFTVPPSGDFYEKFLFYRGVGKFEVPIKVENPSGSRFVVTNLGEEALPRLLVLQVRGDVRRFAFTAPVEAGDSLELPAPATEISDEELRNVVAQELVSTGLYVKEARAMVETWSTSWFGEQGLRLFYLVPQKLTDEILPLTITPQPDEQLRVMVGRVEIMSKSQEKQLLEVVSNSAKERERLAREAAERNGQFTLPPVPDDLLQLGRFAEPALARVREISSDQSIKAEVDLLVWQLQQLEKEAT